MLLLVFRFLLAAAGKIEGSFVARHSRAQAFFHLSQSLHCVQFFLFSFPRSHRIVQ